MLLFVLLKVGYPWMLHMFGLLDPTRWCSSEIRLCAVDAHGPHCRFLVLAWLLCLP